MNRNSCAQCGDPIPRNRYSNAKYCSGDCSNAARQDRRRKTTRRTGVRKLQVRKYRWLDESDKIAIRAAIAKGMPQKAIARKFSISQATVSRVGRS